MQTLVLTFNLVFYLAFCRHQKCCQFICAFTLLSVPSRNPPCPQNSSRKHPYALDSQFKEPLLPTEFQKAVHGKGMDIFWNNPMPQHKPIEKETDNYIDDNIKLWAKINVNIQCQVILGKVIQDSNRRRREP